MSNSHSAASPSSDRRDAVPLSSLVKQGRHRWAGFVLAAALTAAGGIGYRVVAANYASVLRSAPLPPGTLASIPLKIGPWIGRDLPIEERIVKATDTDDRLSRQYSRPGGDTVSVWVAYGVRLRDLMPHRPEVCYVGAGWVLQGERQLDVRASNGSVLPCRMLTFRKAGLESRQIAVLNYYIVGDAYSPDVSSLRNQARQFRPDVDYVVQVQVVQQGAVDGDVLAQPACEFVAEFGPAIRAVLDHAINGAEK